MQLFAQSYEDPKNVVSVDNVRMDSPADPVTPYLETTCLLW